MFAEITSQGLRTLAANLATMLDKPGAAPDVIEAARTLGRAVRVELSSRCQRDDDDD